MHATGSFTAQDLFPSLYNDNSIFSDPSSRLAKLPASCLQTTVTSNLEAVHASEKFLDAVRDHLLRSTLLHSQPPQAGKGVMCGEGLVWPAKAPSVLNQGSGEAAGLFLSYNLHLDHLGIVATANLETVALRSLLPEADPNLSQLSKMAQTASLLLCPVGVPASFVRWFGIVSAAQPSGKLAEKEASSLQHIACAFGGLDRCGDDAVWALVRIGHQEMVWPAEHILLNTQRALACAQAPSVHVSTPPTRRTARVPLYCADDILPAAKRAEKLAELTSAHIERQSREREKQRRERAEKAVVAPAPAQVAGDNPAVTAQAAGQTLAAPDTRNSQIDVDSMPVDPLAQPTCNDLRDPEPTTRSDSVGSGRHRETFPSAAPSSSRNGSSFLGCVPSLAAISAILPSAATAVTSPKVRVAEEDLGMRQDAATGENVYPTPRSTQNGAEHAASQTRAVDAFLDQSSNIESLFSDSFANFDWGTSENALTNGLLTQPFPLASTSADSNAYFDGGMFDSGVTDDDFSFFDTPSLPVSSTLPRFEQHAVGTVLPASDVAAPMPMSMPMDAMQLMGSDAPIDHFGHLMPTGNSPVSSTTMPSAFLQSMGNPFTDAATPSSMSSSKPRGVPDFGWSPSGSSIAASPMFLAEQPTVRHHPQVLHIEPPITLDGYEPLPPPMDSSPALVEEVPQPAMDTKYHLQPLFSRSSSALAKRVLPGFLPVRFSRGHEKTTLVPAQAPESATASALETYRLARSRNIRAHCERHRAMSVDHGAKGVETQRRWRRHPRLQHSLSPESTSDSEVSDDDQHSYDHITDAQASGQPVPVARSAAELGPAFVRFGCSLLDLFMSTDQQASTESTTASTKTKLSKGEKEATATVFLQQMVENRLLRRLVPIESTILCERLQETACPLARSIPALLYAPPFQSKDAWDTRIAVSYHSAIMSLSPLSLSLWPKLALLPHSGRKDVRAFILSSSKMCTTENRLGAEAWLERLAVHYKVSWCPPNLPQTKCWKGTDVGIRLALHWTRDATWEICVIPDRPRRASRRWSNSTVATT